MWPFTHKKRTVLVPAIRCNGVVVLWNTAFEHWEFSIDGVNYTRRDNPVFDTEIMSQLHLPMKWIAELDARLEAEIKEHLEGWCDWTGKKELLSIDVSWLIAKREIDVEYFHDDWGDLGINIVITNGKFTSSYAGD